MTMCSRLISATTVACVLTVVSGFAGADAPNRQAAVGGSVKQAFGTIAEGYRSNRESFSAFSCRFKWTYGTARSIEAARRGELDDKLEHDGVWIVHDQRMRYDLVCRSVNLGDEFSRAAKVAGDAKGSAVVQARGLEQFYLKNDRIRARQSKVIKMVSLYSLDARDSGINVTPFTLGVMGENGIGSPAEILKEVVDGTLSGQYTGAVEEGGKPLAELAVGRKGEPLRWYYRFDPERGYLPMHFWTTDPKSGKTRYEAFILEARNSGIGRWFPTRAIVVMGDKDAPWPKPVRYLHVTELKCEPPDSKDFFLDIASGTRVVVWPSKAVINVRENSRVYESQLQSLVQRATERQAAREREQHGEDIGTATPVSGGWPIGRIIILNAALLLTLLAVFVWRRYTMPTR
jgi:hypothetical protein